MTSEPPDEIRSERGMRCRRVRMSTPASAEKGELHVRNIVGQSAVGEGYIRAAINDYNLCAFIQSPASRRTRSPAVS